MKTTLYTNFVLCLLSAGFLLLTGSTAYAQALSWADSQIDYLATASAELSSSLAMTTPALPTAKNPVSSSEKVKKDFYALGLNLYARTEWDSASEVLTKYLENYNDNSADCTRALYHLALCNLNIEKYHLAAANFCELLSQNNLNSKMKYESEYLRALSLFQFNEAEGKVLMNNIARNQEHIYNETALGILAEL